MTSKSMWMLGAVAVVGLGAVAFLALKGGGGSNSPDFGDQIRNRILSPLGLTKKSSNYGTSNTLSYGDF